MQGNEIWWFRKGQMWYFEVLPEMEVADVVLRGADAVVRGVNVVVKRPDVVLKGADVEIGGGYLWEGQTLKLEQ